MEMVTLFIGLFFVIIIIVLGMVVFFSRYTR
jgi:hypothetical protein